MFIKVENNLRGILHQTWSWCLCWFREWDFKSSKRWLSYELKHKAYFVSCIIQPDVRDPLAKI